MVLPEFAKLALQPEHYEVDVDIRREILRELTQFVHNNHENGDMRKTEIQFLFPTQKVRQLRYQVEEYIKTLLIRLELSQSFIIFQRTDRAVHRFKLTIFQMTLTLSNGLPRIVQFEILNLVSNAMNMEMHRMQLNDKAHRQARSTKVTPRLYLSPLSSKSRIAADGIIRMCGNDINLLIQKIKQIHSKIAGAFQEPFMRFSVAYSAEETAFIFSIHSFWG